ncbi:MAG: aminoacyl-tRNA hydrolase [Dehalococcoidia bacterium]|nr:aminoacyl-tRNA hydrolase [Dehalococcoidia bacterium]MDW8119347.1 aminoacyl-tRNA hydrolase [Chloroflexota bacterium]
MGRRLVVVGLGNPGPQYAATRHNIGRRCVESVARRLGIAWRRELPSAFLARGQSPGGDLVLVRPRTYMNQSGRAVAQVVRLFALDPSRELVVVCDDMDLPLGKLRLRLKGSAGGHKGLASVIMAVGSEALPRLRIGIGRPPPDMDPAAFVLAPFPPGEEERITQAVERAVDGVLLVLEKGWEKAMTWVNAG